MNARVAHANAGATKTEVSSAVVEISTLGPVVQSVVSLTTSLVVKMLTVLVGTISNSQVFLLKNVSSFCNCTFFQQKY